MVQMLVLGQGLREVLLPEGSGQQPGDGDRDGVGVPWSPRPRPGVRGLRLHRAGGREN